MTKDNIGAAGFLGIAIAAAHYLGCGAVSLLAVAIVASYGGVLWTLRDASTQTNLTRSALSASAGGVLALVMGGLVFCWGAEVGYSFLSSIAIWAGVFTGGALCSVAASAIDQLATSSAPAAQAG